MVLCPCSPDMDGCRNCKEEYKGGMIDADDLPNGGKRKWIQEVVSHMKQGAFTAQASRKHMSPEELVDDVKKHPKKYTLKTRRRAQFLRNIRRKTSRRK
jgi:hypothetical protein